MGCGASNTSGGDLAAASPIVPTASSKPKGASGGAPPPAAAASDENSTLQAGMVEAYRAACASFAPSVDPSSAGVPASSLDLVSSSFVGELDIGAIVDYFTSGACQFFSESDVTLELSQANVAELVLVAGEAEEALRLLRAMDAAGQKYEGMLELPAGMQLQQASEAETNLRASTLPAPVVQVALECRAFLAAQTCTVHRHGKLPSVATVAAAAAGRVQDEDAELDINQFNEQLLGTRTRLQFLHPNTLVSIVAAGTDAGAEGAAGQGALILSYLALSEQVYDAPSDLVKGVHAYRLAAAAKRAALEAKKQSAAAGGESAAQQEVPADLQVQVAPLQKALLIVEPSCRKLEPLMAPLGPTLVQLTPTMRHLQAYLARFLPLLQEARAKAIQDGTPPEADATTAQILSAYLIPFIQLMQPWLLQLRPYLSGLQPFFTDLQPFLSETHTAFGLLHPFLVGLQPYVAGDAPFLLSPAFHSFLGARVTCALALLHPLLKQLHPLMLGLLEFIQEVSAFLVQLAALLELLQAYQTLPLEPEEDDDAAAAAAGGGPEKGGKETSKSSIARPWFRPGSSRPSSAATVSAPQFLAKYGRFLGKIVPYVQQLRPFADDVQAFVDKFVPYVGQLAPFYHDQLKGVVTPVLLCLVPTTTAVVEQPPAAAAAAGEMDEAALQRLLSS